MADVDGLGPAVVTSADESAAVAWARDVGPVETAFESMEWAASYIDENHRGDVPKGVGAQPLQRTAY